LFNPNEDIAAPTISQVASYFDFDEEGVPHFNISLRAEDDRTGVEAIRVRVRQPSTRIEELFVGHETAMREGSLIFDPSTSVWSARVPMNPRARSGTYVYSLRPTDGAGNQRSYQEAELLQIGEVATAELSNPLGDEQFPVLEGLNVSYGKVGDEPGMVVSWDVSGSEAYTTYFRFALMGGDRDWDVGSPQSGDTYLMAPGFCNGGVYEARFGLITSASDNRSWYSTEDLIALGIPVEFVLRDPNLPDRWGCGQP
jgi:hypothetical protein